MGKEYFAEEFKLEAVRQVIELGFSVADVAKRLGVSAQSLYKWVRATQPTGEEINKTELWRLSVKILDSDQSLLEPRRSVKF